MAKKPASNLAAMSVHDMLRTKIMTLEFRAGERLVEDDITAMLNVGRTPVREALLRLQGEGLVTRSKGWFVKPIEPSKIQEVFENRFAIEGVATGFAATKISDEVLAELEVMIAEMDEVEGKPRSEINRINHHFHEKIVEASENPFFKEMYERTQFQYWNLRLPIIFTKEQTVASNEQHREIFDGLKAHDAKRAEEAARSHIQNTYEIVSEAFEGF